MPGLFLRTGSVLFFRLSFFRFLPFLSAVFLVVLVAVVLVFVLSLSDALVDRPRRPRVVLKVSEVGGPHRGPALRVILVDTVQMTLMKLELRSVVVVFHVLLRVGAVRLVQLFAIYDTLIVIFTLE